MNKKFYGDLIYAVVREEELRRLIKLMQKDDEKAFEEFFNILYPRFYRYAFLYLKSDVLCDELVSDVFLKLWNVRNKLHEVKKLEFYLFRSVKNQILTYLKKNTITHVELSDYTNSHLIEYNQPEEMMINNELSEKIESAISKLPDKCQTIYRMVKEDGLSYQQVATLLDISKKTVENHMSTALKRLRESVEKYYAQSDVSNRIFIFFVL